MVNYAVFGLGLMGEAIVSDLLLQDNQSQVFGFDIDENRRKYVKNKFSERFHVCHLHLDDTIPINNHPLIKQMQLLDIVVGFGAIDYKYNLYLTKLCIQAKIHFLDLGGNPRVVASQRKLDSSAKKSRITIIPDCGLAPGMANILAAHMMKKFDDLYECHIRVGGLPQKPQTILNYQLVFSIRGLTNEYLENARLIRDGKIITVPSLTELEEIEFPEPFGKLEAFQTAGGTSSLPELYEGKIKELNYKTIRYPGHCQIFQFLKEFELLSEKPISELMDINPRKVIEYHLHKYLPQNKPDVVLVKISVHGKKSNQIVTSSTQIIDFYDKISGYSAMARTTAYSISIIGQMIANKIITKCGVLPGEIIVPEKEFKEELSKRNIKMINTITVHS